jgi:hypothetical protein
MPAENSGLISGAIRVGDSVCSKLLSISNKLHLASIDRCSGKVEGLELFFYAFCYVDRSNVGKIGNS